MSQNLRPTSWPFIRTACAAISDQLCLPCAEPDAAPTNVRTSSTLRNQIDVSWDPPPSEFQNGVIIRYLVRYVSTEGTTIITAITTSVSLTMGISQRTLYLVSVAAVTQAGDGPYSGNISQRTLSMPPGFPVEPPSQSPDEPVTSTTIPIALPNISSLEEYRYTHCLTLLVPHTHQITFPPSLFSTHTTHTHTRTRTHTHHIHAQTHTHTHTHTAHTHTHTHSHFWVIALIVSNAIDTTQDPLQRFPDNSSFTTYSSVEPGVPYIVAEIDSMNYPTTFVLGADDNSSTSLNDLPELYRNGPLTPGTSYTAFVWGFAPSVPVSVCRAT